MTADYRARFPRRDYGLRRRIQAAPYRQPSYPRSDPHELRLTLERLAEFVVLVFVVAVILALMSIGGQG